MSNDIVLCIDLGTTNSAMAYLNPKTNQPECIPNESGEFVTPSVILFLEDEILVGKEAMFNAWENPSGLISGIKRRMGDSTFEIEFKGAKYNPVKISSLILARLKQDAETELGTSISQAMITTPAYFDDHQRKATMEAARLAGLNIETHGIINEPTAAAIYYGLNNQLRKQKVMVYDLGGGTFDITLLEIDGHELNVITSNGNAELGGTDWDERIVDLISEKFKEVHGLYLRGEMLASNELDERAEIVKKDLSVRNEVNVNFSFDGKDINIQITRKMFEAMTKDLLDKTESLMAGVLHDAKMNWDDISDTILAGGSTRMPMVKDMVERISGKAPLATINPDRCVALGAAIKSSVDSSIIVRDVISHSLGMISLENDEFINTIIIPKDSKIPSSFSKNFTNPRDNMTELDVKLLQGEHRDPNFCTLLKHHIFKGIEPLPKNEEKIEVTFAYTVNGTVEISAKDLKTRKILEHEEREIGNLVLEPVHKVPPESVPLNVALIIDCSGSMSGRPIEDAKSAATKFIDDMLGNRDGVKICAVTIGGPPSMDTKLVHKLSSDLKSLKKVIDTITSGGLTPMDDSIDIGYDELIRVAGKRYMVIISDGLPNDKPKAIKKAKKARKKGIDIITIGIGVGEHNRFLKQISTLEHYDSIESGKLTEVFENIFSILHG